MIKVKITDIDEDQDIDKFICKDVDELAAKIKKIRIKYK